MTDLAALVVRMQADNSQYIKALDQATSRLDKFQKEQDSRLEDLAVKIGEAFAVEKIVEFSMSAIEGAASLERMSQSAGISVEQLSGLRLAAAAAGLSQDDLGTALKKVNISISEAAGNAESKAAIAFKLLGISVKDAAGNMKDAGQLLPEIADKFAKMADGPNKVDFAKALGGKGFDKFIPVLNQGAEGLDKFREAAEKSIGMTAQLAQQAEEFEQKASVLKATLVDGLGVQLASKLLVPLNAMVDAFMSGSNAGESLAKTADIIVTGFRLIAYIGLEVTRTFLSIGDGIGNLAAQAVALVEGMRHPIDVGFSQVNQIIADGNQQQLDRNKKFAEMETALWHDKTDAEIKEEKRKFDETAALAKAKPQGPNLAEGIVTQAAQKKLEQFRDTLKEQADAFDLGGAALVRFKLSTGSLADDLKKAGDQAGKLRAEILANADALQTKKDNKAIEAYTEAIVKQIVTLDQGSLAAENYALRHGELGKALDRAGAKGEEYRKTILAVKQIEIGDQNAKALEQISIQADKTAGNLNKAALAAYDLQTKTLRQNLANNPEGTAQLDADRKLIDAQSKINELNLKAAEINSTLAATESKINLARTQGQISYLTAQDQESAARSHALDQLNAIYASEQQIAAGVNDPALVDGVKNFGIAIDTLKAQTTALENQVRGGLEQSFANNFSNLITGASNFKQALLGFLKDIDKQFADMIAKDYAEKLFAPASGSSSGGALGGLAGILAGLMGSSGSGNGLSAASNASIAATGAGSTDAALAALPGLAGGGTIPTGKFAIVGEHGPELAYSGAKDMTIIPQDRSLGNNVSVTNHFVIEAQGGTISRASQMQTAAAAARSLQQASRRNNS